MISCKSEQDYFGEHSCGYDAEFGCDECICTGGMMSPVTGKKFRGNRAKYEEVARNKNEIEDLSLDDILKKIKNDSRTYSRD